MLYLHLSIAVGLAQILDAVYLWCRKGVISTGPALFGFFEYIWAGVSIAMIASLSHGSQVPAWLPISFATYVFFGWMYGISNRKKFKKGKIYVLPKWLVVSGGLFGAYFSAASYGGI